MTRHETEIASAVAQLHAELAEAIEVMEASEDDEALLTACATILRISPNSRVGARAEALQAVIMGERGGKR